MAAMAHPSAGAGAAVRCEPCALTCRAARRWFPRPLDLSEHCPTDDAGSGGARGAAGDVDGMRWAGAVARGIRPPAHATEGAFARAPTLRSARFGAVVWDMPDAPGGACGACARAAVTALLAARGAPDSAFPAGGAAAADVGGSGRKAAAGAGGDMLAVVTVRGVARGSGGDRAALEAAWRDAGGGAAVWVDVAPEGAGGVLALAERAAYLAAPAGAALSAAALLTRFEVADGAADGVLRRAATFECAGAC